MPYSKLREYKGKGNIKFKKMIPLEEEATFTLCFYSNSKIKVKASFILPKVEIESITEILKTRLELSLNGVLFDEKEESKSIGTISTERMIVVSQSCSINEFGTPLKLQLEMLCLSHVNIIYYDNEESVCTEIRYGLTNFTFLGCEFSRKDKGYPLDKFNAEINNLTVLFKKVEEYEDIEQRLKANKGCHVTSEAIISLTTDESTKARSMILTATELLSLATRNFVSLIYEDCYYNGNLIRTTLKPGVLTNYNNADQLIDTYIHDSICTLKDYLETTYNKYQEFKDTFNLRSVIHLYLISRFLPFNEARFLLTFVSLECLLDSYEEYLKNTGTPVEPSLVKKTKKTLAKELKKDGVELDDKSLDRIAASIAYPHTTFEEKLISVLKTYGIAHNPKDLELTRLRNKIAHTGKFPETLSSRTIVPDDELKRLIYLLDRILLSLLGYHNKPLKNIFNNYREETLS